ncbi:hypothetical protein KM043_006690 [Ampulex compressa]|nr:hypothetical protein KM043_006690 [Ampulex compressa]
MVPDMWLEIDEERRGSGNRSFIAAGLVEAQWDYERFEESMDCIVDLLDHSVDRTYGLSLFLPRDLEIADLFLTSAKINASYYLLSEEMEARERYTTWNSGAVVLLRDYEDLEQATSHMSNICSASGDYVVIMARHFPSEELFLAEAGRIVELMWNHTISRLVALAPVRDTFALAGSVGFVSDARCKPSEPVLLSECKVNGWQPRVKIQRLPLNGCSISLGYFDVSPYVTVTNRTRKLGGIEGIIMRTIAKNLKMGLLDEKIEWGTEVNFVERIKTLLGREGKFDMAVGGILWNPSREVGYTATYAMVKIAWVIPVKSNVSLRGLITPFRISVWLTIIGTLFLGGVVKIFLVRDISFLDIFGMILCVSTSKQPTRMSSRIQFLAWALFGFFITQFYLGAMADQLVNASNLQMDTISELLLSRLKLGGTNRFFHFFGVDEDEDTDSLDPFVSKIFNVFDHEDYEARLKDLLEGKNDTYALVAMLNISHIRLDDVNPRIHVMAELVASNPVGFAIRRGLPYLAEIDSQIQLLIDVGIFGYWIDRMSLRHNYFRTDDQDNDHLGMAQLLPAFLLLILGYTLAICMIVAEVIAYPSKFLE